MAGTGEPGTSTSTTGKNRSAGKKQSWLAANVTFVSSTFGILALVSTQLVTIGEAFSDWSMLKRRLVRRR